MVVDDNLSIIGTDNMDYRSFDINFAALHSFRQLQGYIII